jgi:hypothetical protein
MVRSSEGIDVYLETGKKRTFAGAIDWPGWCRSGRNEQEALQALVDYAPRYAHALRLTELRVPVPVQAASLMVCERHGGTASTEFGVPSAAAKKDAAPVEDAELKRFQTLLQACWREFDAAVKAADGNALRKGPRGGGRELNEIVAHVPDAEVAYLGRVGWKLDPQDAKDPQKIRNAILEALMAAVRGELPKRGPRGGKYWGPRYFVRRAAWHILDHAWEIEDRAVVSGKP